MEKIRRNIVLFLVLVFIYPDISSGIHYLLFHKAHKHYSNSEVPVYSSKEFDCPFENIKYTPFEFEGLVQFGFYYAISSIILFKEFNDSLIIRKKYSFQLRAPPFYLLLSKPSK